MDPDDRSSEASMMELAALLETAGGESAAWVLQTRDAPDPRSFLGAGKVCELRTLVEANACTLAVFDNELSPSQARVLEAELGVRVLDRAGLILDIFASRAATHEGRLQVELAQYKYLLPRLTGMWTHLVRQTASGGSSPIGTRGPGETQLETDRRHIRRRIQKLEQELEQVRRVRGTQRRRREKNAIATVALVGYTNVGKSTLLNCLTGASIHTGNRLFDTLDTTTRRLELPQGGQALLSDTVGFIRKLPTHLIEAFKATLEELAFADLLLHVIDASSPDWERQAVVADALIAQLSSPGTPCLRVYNKCDACAGELPRDREGAYISAATGEGTQQLLLRIEQLLGRDRRLVTLRLPYSQAALLDRLRRQARIEELAYADTHILVRAVVGPELWGSVRDWAERG